MRARLGYDERLCSLLIPEWPVGCRRETPGPGYLECFLRSNVKLEKTEITRVNERGESVGIVHQY
jgi:hypothetical protein